MEAVVIYTPSSSDPPSPEALSCQMNHSQVPPNLRDKNHVEVVIGNQGRVRGIHVEIEFHHLSDGQIIWAGCNGSADSRQI